MNESFGEHALMVGVWTEVTDTSDFKAGLRRKASAAGFFDVGVAAACLPEVHAQRLRDWQQRGMHGEMSYMARENVDRANADTVLPGARSVLVFASSYYAEDVTPAPSGLPKIARYARGEDYHIVLRERLEGLLPWLMNCFPEETWRICIDSAPVLERAYAAEAGIGFIGRNTMMISPGKGSFYFLAEIFTTALIEPDAPSAGTCGTCTRCIDACPTGAIVEPNVLDATRCISYLTIEKKSELTTEEQAMTGDWLFGCDICQDVCPYNKHPAITTIREFGMRPVDGVETAELIVESKSNRQFARAFERSPLLRAGRRKLQRNLRAKQRG